MEKGIVYKGQGIFSYCGWPTLARLEDGTLAVAFSGHRLAHVCTFGETMIVYSYDNGKTWTKPMSVVSTQFDDRDGGLCVNGKQVLLTTFNNNYSIQAWHADNHEPNLQIRAMIHQYIDMNKETANEDDVASTVWVSEDGGKTFPKSYKMPITSPHGPRVLSDGRYIYVGRAFHVADAHKTPGRVYNELKDYVYYMYSSDGYTWTDPVQIPIPDERIDIAGEPDVYEKSNGELLVLVRVHRKQADWGRMYMYQVESYDNRTKWTEPRVLDLVGGPPHILKLSSGRLLCVFGCRKQPYAEKGIVSDDEGKTWSKPFVIDGDGVSDDLGYPSSIEMEDGSILTVYYQDNKEDAKPCLRYTRWSLDEVNIEF